MVKLDTISDYPIFIFHPEEPIRIAWDVVIMIFMIYLLFEIPVQLCFQLILPLSNPWCRFDLILDVFFLLDIVFNFNTGLLDRDCKLVTCRMEITKTYLKSWFCIDLVTSIPFEYLTPSMVHLSYVTKMTRFLKFFRVLRLLKFIRVMKAFSRFEESSESSSLALRFLKCTLLIFLIAHYAACIFVGIQALYRNEDQSYENMYGYDENSWLVRFQDTWEQPHLIVYLRSIYWAFTTLATVGYGDITPLLPLEIIFTILVQLCGCSLFGIIYYMTRNDATTGMIKNKISAVREHILYRKLPRGLSQKIRRQYGFVWKQNQIFNEKEILSDLPQTLRTECTLFMHKNMIKNFSFLSNLCADAYVLSEIILRLKPANFSPEAVLLKEGQIGHEMYFVWKGSLVMSLTSCTVGRGRIGAERQEACDILIKRIQSGEDFSDYSLVTDQTTHPITVTAETFCDLFILTRMDFIKFGEGFPMAYEDIVSKIKCSYADLMETVIKKRQQYLFMLAFCNPQYQSAFSQIVFDAYAQSGTRLRTRSDSVHAAQDKEHSMISAGSASQLNKFTAEMQAASSISLGMRLKYHYLSRKASQKQFSPSANSNTFTNIATNDRNQNKFLPKSSRRVLQRFLQCIQKSEKNLVPTDKYGAAKSSKHSERIWTTPMGLHPYVLEKILSWKDQARLQVTQRQLDVAKRRFKCCKPTHSTETPDTCSRAMQKSVQDLKCFVQKELDKFKACDSGTQCCQVPQLQKSTFVPIPLQAPSSAVSQIEPIFVPNAEQSTRYSESLPLQQDIDDIKEKLNRLRLSVYCIGNHIGVDVGGGVTKPT